MDNKELNELLDADYIDPLLADKFNRIISAKMLEARSEEIKLIREQLDFIKEQAKNSDKESKRMFAIAMCSLVITAASVIVQIFV